MNKQEILNIRDKGEVTRVQFKERILDKYDIGCEMVAMSNYRGGQIVIGINDKTGEFNPLSEFLSLTTGWRFIVLALCQMDCK